MTPKDQKQRAVLVKGMLATAGWQSIIKPELVSHQSEAMINLVNETDEYKIRQLQAEIRAIRYLLQKIEFYDSIAT